MSVQDSRLEIRLTWDEKVEICRLAKEAGLGVSEFLRRKVLGDGEILTSKEEKRAAPLDPRLTSKPDMVPYLNPTRQKVCATCKRVNGGKSRPMCRECIKLSGS